MVVADQSLEAAKLQTSLSGGLQLRISVVKKTTLSRGDRFVLTFLASFFVLRQRMKWRLMRSLHSVVTSPFLKGNLLPAVPAMAGQAVRSLR
jgi:hypothetical protein